MKFGYVGGRRVCKSKKINEKEKVPILVMSHKKMSAEALQLINTHRTNMNQCRFRRNL